MRKFRVPTILILVVALFGLISPASATPWETKVDAWVLETAAQGPAEFLVMLKEQADLSPTARLATKAERGQYTYQALSGVAQRSQAPVIAALQRMGAEYRAYWVVNALWVRGDLGIIAALAQRPDVQHLYANPYVKLDAPLEEAVTTTLPEGIEWNIVKVGAPEVWAQGYTGQGVVVGGADTGYDWEHPALINQYRGWDGSTASHDYNWFDATVDHSLIPVDPYPYGHGTHTMGIMVGDDGGTNQIGMAPGARWIGCRNMDASGYGTPATYMACYQWFIAPTRVDGVSDPHPDLAPDVINNSWACLVSEGCDDPEILHEAVQNVRAAGILTTHSAGNNGPTCGTINTPAAIYAESLTVGATDIADNLASISSRGPVTVDGSNRRKPDISAPGVNIRSCIPGGNYTVMSGTSMAAPHVAGLVALLISANPDLRGQVDALEAIIELSALHKPSLECSSVFSYPNNLYGWGRIQAQEAVKLTVPTLTLGKTAAVESISPSQVFSYTLTVTNTSVFTITNSAILTDTLPVGTEFYAASEPYFLSNREVMWNLGQLAAGKAVAVELGVRVREDAGSEVVNADYGVSVINGISVAGEPVVTAITRYTFLPLIVR